MSRGERTAFVLNHLVEQVNKTQKEVDAALSNYPEEHGKDSHF